MNSLSKNKYKLNEINWKNSSLVFLLVICVSALVVRFHYLPYNIPVTLDGFSGYFLYALDISILGKLPEYTPNQSGWPELLSVFFTFFHSDNFLDYMNLQRTVSVVLSGITVIPIYFICKKFFNSNYALIGSIIFAFDPRIIINSTLGITEPLYILAITLGILFFLNSNKKIIYLAFAFFAWATIIRPEGQFWFVAFTIAYFVRFRKNRQDSLKFLIALAIFLLVLTPIVYHRIQCCETDGIVGRMVEEIKNNISAPDEPKDQAEITAYGPNWINGIKLFGWSIIPIFVVLVPIGLILIFKQLKYPNYLLVLAPAVLAIPIMYSVSIAPDTRYVYPLFPILCVISLFGISWIVEKFSNKKVILSLIVISIIFGSMTFLEIKKIDYSGESEVYQVAKFVAGNTSGVNSGAKVEKYLMVAEMANRWPVTSTPGNLKETFEIKQFPLGEVKTLEEFIAKYKEQKLTHIAVDQYSGSVLSEVYSHGEKFPYLEKIYESNEHGYKYNLKLYKINYDDFDKYNNSN